MRYFYESILPHIDGLEINLNYAAFAFYVSINFGASEYLLLLVQYLFMVDFFLGILDAKKAKKFSWSRAWFGIKKIISLYLGVLVVGFGTKAFDVALKGRIEIDYNGAFCFDIFICVLIIFELASINGHLAHFGFGVNQYLDAFIYKFKGKAQAKVENLVEKALETEDVKNDK